MTGIAILTAITALGIDYGWQPVAGGGVEYIIQLEPAALEALRNGDDIFSTLPADLRGVRSYRITAGTGPLPHHGQLPPVPEQPALEPRTPEPPSTASPSTTLLPPLTTPGQTSSPPTLAPLPHSDPLVQPAGGGNSENPASLPTSLAPEGTSEQVTVSASTTEPERPWILLAVVLLALFASLGANAYLGMIGYGLHRRCRELLGQLKTLPR